MITLEDCIAFCETPPALVEEVAEQQSLPVVLACAYLHASAVEDGAHAPQAFAPDESRFVA